MLRLRGHGNEGVLRIAQRSSLPLCKDAVGEFCS